MNDELRRILTQLGVAGLDERGAWTRLVIVRNFRRVPQLPGQPTMGFKFLLLDRRGRVEWFGRSSWSDPETMRRETSLLEALMSDPLGRAHVPEVRTGFTPRIFVQISRYLGECAYSGTLESLAPARWAADAREIIAMSERLLVRATTLAPDLDPRAASVARHARVTSDLVRLAQNGIPDLQLKRLASALEEVRALPAVLQHGDLWPANVLRHDGNWWLIDYSECGHVWMPGYDLFHLLSTAPSAARAPWYARGDGAPIDEWARVRWDLLDEFAARHSIDRRQLGATLVHYLVHLTAYRLRPGVPEEFSASLVREVERVADFLSDPNALERLIPPGSVSAHRP